MIKTSEQVDAIQEALSEFKKNMPPVKRANGVEMKGKTKDGREYKVNYEYAPLEQIQEKARPHLVENGLSVAQMLGFEIFNNEPIPCIVTRVCHKSGQYIQSSWIIDLSGISKEQDRGSKITYNKRYCYTAALDIALEDEDNDAQEVPLSEKKQIPKTEYKKDPYVFIGGQYKGKKFDEVSAEDFLKELEKYEQVANKSKALIDLMDNMNVYLSLKNIGEIKNGN